MRLSIQAGVKYGCGDSAVYIIFTVYSPIIYYISIKYKQYHHIHQEDSAMKCIVCGKEFESKNPSL